MTRSVSIRVHPWPQSFPVFIRGPGQAFDNGRVLRKKLQHGAAIWHLEIGKIEAGCDGAADQGFFIAAQRRAKPDPGRHHHLQFLAGRKIAPEPGNRIIAGRVDLMNVQTATGVVIPDFILFQPMKTRHTAGKQHKINRGHNRPRPDMHRQRRSSYRARRPENLGKPATFGVRLHLQCIDPVLRLRRNFCHNFYKLFQRFFFVIYDFMRPGSKKHN